MCPLSAFLLSSILDGDSCHKTRKSNKKTLKFRKEEVNLFLFTNDMTVEVENLKDSVK